MAIASQELGGLLVQMMGENPVYPPLVTAVNYTATPNDRIIAVNNSIPRVITLPLAADCLGKFLTVLSVGSNQVSVSRSGSDTIRGNTSSLVITANQSVTVYAWASGKWAVVSSFEGTL